MLAPEARGRLARELEDARARGMLGPGPVEAHLDHAEMMAGAIDPGFCGSFLDLGSGAGVPGLVLLETWPGATGTLLDARRRRCSFLEAAVARLGMADRASVVRGRAEELGREAGLRGAFELVVARGFGGPATTAECAVGFLGRGGRVVVSEPPAAGSRWRWPAEGLAQLGLSGPEVGGGSGGKFAILTMAGPVSERWPRRVGVPGRRPLW
jgi:16S rRNA (guanine527-N7)-methyltransferase